MSRVTHGDEWPIPGETLHRDRGNTGFRTQTWKFLTPSVQYHTAIYFTDQVWDTLVQDLIISHYSTTGGGIFALSHFPVFSFPQVEYHEVS